MRQVGLLVILLLCAAGGPSHAADAVRFVAFGDSGSGSGGQMAVAQAMSEVCVTRGCDFAVMLGDNFYPEGVHSAHDAQFETKFEEPYEALDMPFFATLGNHDNGGNGARNRLGDFQVAYAQRQDRGSDKFRMPARYYHFSVPLDSAPVRAEPFDRLRTGSVEAPPLIDFYALDSSPLAPYVDDPDPKWKPESYAAAQLQWAQRALKESRAVWKIAFAHHPYISDGGHGSAGHYLVRGATSKHFGGKLWRDLLEKSVCAAGVDLFLQAHDHDLEWLKPVAACGKTEFVTSGAGGAQLTPLFNNSQPMHWQQSNRFGFFWFEVNARELKGAAFALDEDAEMPRDDQGKPKPAFERSIKR